MTRYVWGRLGQGVLVLWAAYTLTFLILYLLPGDPVRILLYAQSGAEDMDAIDPALVEALRSEWGLDRPLIVQYLDSLWSALRLDFGNSYQTSGSAGQRVLDLLPNTLILGAAGLLLAVVLGVLLAIAINFTTFAWLRRLLAALPPLGVSVPGFWIGLLLIQVFAFQLRLLPPMGDDGIRELILPALTLAIPTSASIAQLLSRSLGQTLLEPYIDVARAKGANTLGIFGHAFRNAVLPVLTMVGMMVGNLFAGAAITETVFSRDGIGRLTVEAVNAHDVPVVQVLVLIAAALFVFSSLVTDLVYPLVDPRIKLNLKQTAERPGVQP